MFSTLSPNSPPVHPAQTENQFERIAISSRTEKKMMRDNKAPPIRKSPTLKSQHSMQLPLSLPPSPTATQSVPTKPLPLIEFPTSPERIVGEEMLHFSHPHHPLSHINLPHLFTCSGCQELGAAKRYACQLCNYQLHEFCALAPQALKSHPLHYQHQLVFYSKPGTTYSSKRVSCFCICLPH